MIYEYGDAEKTVNVVKKKRQKVSAPALPEGRYRGTGY
jgi:hypothetical protein